MNISKFIGICIILAGIIQIYTGRKMYFNIKRQVKDPQPYVFIGVTISIIMGILFLVVGVFWMR